MLKYIMVSLSIKKIGLKKIYNEIDLPKMPLDVFGYPDPHYIKFMVYFYYIKLMLIFEIMFCF